MHSSSSASSFGPLTSPTLKTKVNHLLHKQIKNIKIIKLLGTGGNASVYLGSIIDEKHHKHHLIHHKHDNEQPPQYVAVKQLHSEDMKHVQHLTEEYCIASQLQHENIIKVMDLFYEHYWCYVSEFGGIELFTWIEQGMTTIQCNKAFKQLLSAIKYLHEMGICHRDIKPENILCQDEVVKLCDFGLAVRYKSVFDDEETLITGQEGSDPYMAPEQWLGPYSGPFVDVWAVAITYTTMILKKKVWCKATQDDVYFMQYKKQGKNWKDFSKISDAALALIVKMLDINPATRISAKDAIDYAQFHL